MILHVQKICYQAFANVRRANITNDPELVQTRVHFRRGGARAQTHGKAVRAFCSASSLAPSLGFQPAVSSARSKARSRPDGYASSQRRHGDWIGGRIDPTLVKRGFYFVVVCERGKHAGLEDSDR